MAITRGISFASTEQITNTKLQNLIDLSSLAINWDEFSNNVLTSLPTTAGLFKTRVFVTSIASGGLLRADGSGGWYAATP